MREKCKGEEIKKIGKERKMIEGEGEKYGRNKEVKQLRKKYG